jgi:hypothetical protein
MLSFGATSPWTSIFRVFWGQGERFSRDWVSFYHEDISASANLNFVATTYFIFTCPKFSQHNPHPLSKLSFTLHDLHP